MASDPQSMAEQGAYALLREVLFDLSQAERALAIVQAASPDDERAIHLATIRKARAQLETFL